MFRGNHPTRVDEKGRLKLPAEFKRRVDELYGPQFYITSLDGKRAQIYPLKEWEKIEAQVAKLSSMDPVTEEVSGRDELLRPDGRDGRAGPVADSAVAAGFGEGDGRGECSGIADVPGSGECRVVQG